MKVSLNRSTVKSIFTVKNIAANKIRFLLIASFVLIAVSGTVAFSSTTATGSISELFFSGVSGSASFSEFLNTKSAETKAFKANPVLALAPESVVNTMTTARQSHSATKLDNGSVLIVGGDAGGTAEILDAATSNSATTGSLSIARANHTATKLSNGRVLISGGTNGGAAVASSEIYDAATATFSAGATMNAPRSGHTATVLSDGRILITGGSADGTAEIYDAASSSFTAVANAMTTPRSNHSAALLNDGRVLIVGGDNLSSGEIFDPSNSSFTNAGSMEDSRARALLRVLPDGKVQIIGGNNHRSMEIYDAAANIFGAHAHIPPDGDQHATFINEIMNSPSRAALLNSGQTITELPNQALVAGGSDGSGNPINTITIYQSSSASVTTDVLDYPPGTPVIITGRGFQPNETVDLTFHEDPHVNTENPHVFTVQADTDGNFVFNQYAPEEADLGITYILGAKGQTSGRTAQTTFHDNKNLTITFAGTGGGSISLSAVTGSPGPTTNPCNGTPNPCVNSLNNNATGTLTVTPNVGSVFTGWSFTSPLPSGALTTCVGTVTSCTFNLGSGGGNAIDLTATFSGNAATTTTVASSANPSTFGNNVTFTASVKVGAAAVTSGSVTFIEGGTCALPTTTLAGPTALNGSGQAAFSTSTLTVPTHTITACYGGAAGFNSSNGSVIQTVNKANQTITFGALAAKTYGDAAITVSATGGASGNPVTFTATGNCTSGGTNGATVTITGAGSCTVTASQAGNTNYNAAPNVPQSFTINQKTLTPNITASNKIYDGTTAASFLTRTLTGGIVGTDNVTLTGGTATFDNKNVGTGKTVTATGLTLSGTAAGNYVLSSTGATTTADIFAKTVTPSVTVNNKTYDGATGATIATRTLSGVIAPETVTLTGGTASFADRTVGTNKTVNITGLTLGGADAGNYALSSTSATTTADITALHITGNFTADNKVYDRNTSATVLTRSLNGVITGDVVSLSGGTASFGDKNVSNSKTVTLTGATLAGADAGNYVLDSVGTTTADITALAITGSVTANNKVYDGNTTATIATRTLAGIISGDVVSYSGGAATFDNKNVGTGKTVTANGLTLSGADAGNYTVNATATATADITARPLVITATGVNKIYDGTTTATVTFSDDRVSGDVLTVGYTGATFADKNVGSGKAISVSGINLSGTDAANYSLSGTTANATANITPRTLTVTATGVNKVYDRTTSATVNLSSDAISGDTLTLGYTSASFADKNAGTGKAVSVSGISVSGTDSGNYSLGNTTANTTADITAKNLIVTATAANKTYDGTTSAVASLADDRISGDVLTLAYGSATFDTKTAGTNKTVTVNGISISGADAANYSANTSTTALADITALTITGTITVSNKVYDGTTAATIFTRSLTGVIAPDVVSYDGGTASFAGKNVGSGKLVTATGLGLIGADAGNYSVNATATANADITVRTLTVSASGVNKTYDGTPTATVNLSDDKISGDVLTTGYTNASFNNKNVGTNKPVSVSGISITGGADALNYVLASMTANTTADITVRNLIVSATAVNRIYDGTTAVTVMLTGDNVAGDMLTINFAGAAFDTKDVGTGKTVTINGITVTGGDMNNYVLSSNSVTTTADITARTLAITTVANSKTYDGNANASVTLSDNRVSGDTLAVSFTGATFDNKNAGMGKTVTVNGISISGTDSGNYSANTSTTALANITALTITGSITASSKVYDGTMAATILTRSLTGVVGLDVVTYDGGTATFDTKNVGNAKPVSATGLSLSGADAGNYSVNSSASTTANITARTLTVSASGINKTYDGTAAATVNLSDDKVSGDNLTIGYTTASFNNRNVGTGKPVSVSGISITGGTDSGNYSLGNATASTTADITVKSLTVTATGQDKEYNGNATAVVTLADNRILGDILTTTSASALFDSANAGTNKPISVTGISISGTDAGNYALANTTAATTANITAKALTVSASGINKVYDGTTAATVTLSTAGAISGDDVAASYGTAAFADKSVGTAKVVTVSGIILSGTTAGNYTVNTSTTTTANITGASVTGSFTAASKVYDGTTTAMINGRSLAGVIGSDDVSLSGGTAAFGSKTVGTGKTVSANGFTLSGADAGNYILAAGPLTTTADITARPLTVSASGVNKTYDGAPSATVTLSDDRVTGDLLSTSYTSASFADKFVGSGKPVSVSGISISGADAGNYIFNTTAAATADINTKALTVSATGVNKVYDATTSATVSLSDDRVSGDVFTRTYTSASFINKTVGTGKSVSVSGISISGVDAVNYTFNTTASTTADITALAITGSVTASSKVYDGNPTATILTKTLTGVISGDVVSYVGGSATFDNKNVGTGKTVTAVSLSLSGADAGNYTVNATATTTANITVRTLTVTTTASNKVYDGNANAAVILSDNRVSGDVLSVAYTSALFNNANIGTGKPVTVSGISIGGTDAANYVLASNSASTTANITAAGTATGVSVSPASVQYSDTVTFSASVAATNVSLNNQLSGAVQFYLNGTAFGSPVAATVTGAGGAASLTFNNQLAPNGYTVSAAFASTNPNLSGSSSGNAALTVTREDARIFYTGMLFVNTTSATSSTATVQLSATVKDITAVLGDPAFDANAGDISKATLTFVNRDSNTDIATVPISLVSAGDPKVGTAVYNWNVNIGSADSLDYTVGFRVNGYYTRDASTDSEVVTISKPLGTFFITGGGHLVMTNPTSSAGQYAGADGLKTNFGFNVKYNSSGRSLQGRVNVIVRGSGGKVYQIKGNQMDTLTVNNANPAARTAIYTGKCNLTDITDPLLPISLGGGHSFQMKMTDKGEPGNTDTIGITVYGNNTGALLFSSRWNGTTTIEQLLGGGNTVVR